jgi:hypothetical protein
MQSVTVVVGVTGTGLWNAIWMRDGGLGVQVSVFVLFYEWSGASKLSMRDGGLGGGGFQLFHYGVGFKGGTEFELAIRHGPGHYVVFFFSSFLTSFFFSQLFPYGVGFKGGTEFELAIRHGPGHYVAWHAPRYYKKDLYANGRESCGAPRGCTPGTQFTCFTSTKVQILTPEERDSSDAPRGCTPDELLGPRMLTYADVC